MSDGSRLGIVVWLLAGSLAMGHAHAADPEVIAAGERSGPLPAVAEGDADAEVDAFLEPWRRVRIARLIPDRGRACLPAALGLPATAVRRELAADLETMAQSPLGAWLIAQATARRVLVCQDPNTRLAAYYRGQMRLIGVLARLPGPAKVMYLAHELAHVPQHPQFANDRRFGPRAMLLIHRLREATAEAMATRVLWQLRARAARAPWDYKLRSGYGDIAAAFARAIDGAHGEGAELRAMRAAFDQWFERPRRLHQYDGHMLDHLERIVRDSRGLGQPSRPLTDGFLRGIGGHAGTTFLPAGTGRPLTDAYYAGGLSAANAARLDAVLERVPPLTAGREDSARAR
jgi:hypothetical protein